MSASKLLSRSVKGLDQAWRNRRRVLPWLLCGVAASSLSHARAESHGLPFAPLGQQERADAVHAAGATGWPQGKLSITARAPHPLGVQRVLVSIADGKRARASGERTARVYEYDHSTQRARRVDVSLPDGRTLRSSLLTTPHLPLNEAERRWAQARVLAVQPDRVAGMPWTAFVYEPLNDADPCHRERCALLSFTDSHGAVLAYEPVVQFGDGRVRALSRRSQR